MARLQVRLGERSYDVVVECGAVDRIGRHIKDRIEPTRVLLVGDENVLPLYGARARRSLAEAWPIRVSSFGIPAGESQKNLRAVEMLYREMVRAGLDRKSLVVALGGGVVGDVVGFAAATYMRGVPFVQIPTTIVAQVDSSIGGKTGVDLPEGKNLVGAFHQPVAVVADPETLRTLPIREVRAGLAEVVKHGVIRDADYFGLLEEHGSDLLEMDGATAEGVIVRSVRIKADVVSADERESGLRAILNFGHTAGHALEAVTGYEKYSHGEAVAIGMVVAAWLGERMGLCDDTVPVRIAALLDAIGLPTAAGDASAAAVIEAMSRDKKAVGGAVRFVLPRRIGEVEVVSAVPEPALREALAAAGFAP
jgi:3-dehydroquinate synthase